MKRFLAILLALILVPILTVPVYAYQYKPVDLPKIPELNIDWSNVIKIPDSFWDDWFDKNPLPDIEVTDPTEPTVGELETPVISTAKYVHKTPYYGQSKRLEIRWDEVDGAENYEVLITKADKSTLEYIVSSNSIYDKDAKCPKIYVEETSTWTAATVKVRAVADGIYSEWSEAVKISCDASH